VILLNPVARWPVAVDDFELILILVNPRVTLAPSADKITRRASLESVQLPKAVNSNQLVTATDVRLGRSLDLPRHDEDNMASLQTLDASSNTAEVPRTLDKKKGNSGLRVLVADDNATNLEVLTRMLLLEKVSDVEVAIVSRRSHTRVSCQASLPRSSFLPYADISQNGREAYDKAKADMERGNRFDIIFMDIQVRIQNPCSRVFEQYLTLDLDARNGWRREYATYSSAGVYGTHRGIDSFCRGWYR
jgi:CheY-like chemotaxis protein